MVTSLTIRNIPTTTRDVLASRAARTGRSLQEYLRAHLVDLAAQPDIESLIDGIRARKQRLNSHLSADAILAHRDAARR